MSNIEKYLNAPNESKFIRINEHDFIEDDDTESDENSSRSIETLKKQGNDISSEALEKEMGKMLMALSAIAAEKKVYSEQLLIDCVEETIKKYES